MTKRIILPLQMECMMLFQSDPLLAVTIEELAGKLGGKQEELQPVLDLLVKQGIVRQTGEVPMLLFSYQELVTVAEFEIEITNRKTIL